MLKQTYLAYLSCGYYGQRKMIHANNAYPLLKNYIIKMGFCFDDAKEIDGYIVDDGFTETLNIFEVDEKNLLRNEINHNNYPVYLIIMSFNNEDTDKALNEIIEAFNDLNQCDFNMKRENEDYKKE